MLIRLFLGCISIYAIYAASDVPSMPEFAKNTYQGQTVTAQNLRALMPPVPASALAALNVWLTSPKAVALLEQILPFKPRTLYTKFPADRKALQDSGFTNLSRTNYVLSLDEAEDAPVLKIASIKNRFTSLAMGAGIDQCHFANVAGKVVDKRTGEDVVEKLPVDGVTYQTASRGAYWLILDETLRTRRYITTPATYLTTYPSDAPTIDDNHALIIQEALPQDKVLLTPEIAATLDVDVVEELVDTVIRCGLWNTHRNIFVLPKSDTEPLRLSLVDNEQPNNTVPEIFFHQSDVRFSGNVDAGIGELLTLFAGNIERLNVIKRVVENHAIINSERFAPNYKADVMQRLQCIPDVDVVSR
jgi:hypothetical protein